MKKLSALILFAALMTLLPVKAAEFTFILADDYGYEGGEVIENLMLNEDIQLEIEKGNADATFNKSRYVQISPNSTTHIKGATDDVVITKIEFLITTNSYRYYVDSTTVLPNGDEFTWDSDNKLNIWSYDTGANDVSFNTIGPVRIKEITVTYTGGKLGAGGVAPNPSTSKRFTFQSADLGFTTTDNLNEKSPISLNEDIQIGFEGGNAYAKYATAGNGYINVYPNTTIYVKGCSDDVNIEEIIFRMYRKSYRMTAETKSVPNGTITWDEELLENTWVPAESGDIINAVQFTTGYDSPRIESITIKYSGGTASGGEINPDNPIDPEPEEPTDEDPNLLSTGFDTAAEWNQFTIINVETGSNTWKRSDGNPYAKIENDLGNTTPKDDYLVSPGLQLKAGMTYRLSFDTWCGIPDYPETLDAYISTEATVIPTVRILDEITVTNDSYHKRNVETLFTVDADGTYYLSIHASSAPGMHYLYVDNVEVSRGVDVLRPDMVANFSCNPSPMGENSVTLSFTAPSVCFDGTASLDGPVSVVISRDGTQIATLESNAGAELTYTDNLEKSGNYSYAVTAVAASGKSLDAKASVYVGVYRPAAPANLKIVETTPGTIEVSWDPVTTNIYGHTVDSSLVTYNLYEGLYTGYQESISDNKITIEYVSPDEPQKIAYFSVKAVTSAGESTSAAVSETMAIGTPFAMPFVENFVDAELAPGQNAEFAEDPNIAGLWWRCFESTGDIEPVTYDKGMLAFISNYAGTTSTFRTGKIHIDEDASNPYLSFFYYIIPGSESYMTLTVNSDEICTIEIDGEAEGWKEKLVSLEEYKGQDVRIGFVAYCVSPSIAMAIDNISVKNERNNDLAIIRARIPYEMHLGEEHACQIKVVNNGVNNSGAFTISVKADNTEVTSFSGSNLERGETTEYNFSLKPDVRPGETVIYDVVIEAAADENEEDNIAKIEVKIPEYNLPSPTGLAIDGMQLTWSAFEKADFPKREIVESFEAYDEFKIDTAGEWSFYDGDQYPTFGIENSYLSYPNMYEPMAFMTFNNCDGRFIAFGSASYEPYDGVQCMVSFAANSADRVAVPNDDWMISPELPGESQTISFYARSRSNVFPETFQILYTTNEDPLNVATYQLIDEYEEISNEWTEFTAELPAGAKYFAIRNVSNNRYMLFVDYVTFEAAGKEVAVSGYNLYGSADGENWTKINESLLSEPTASLEGVSSGYVRVHAIFENGIETQSDEYDLEELGLSGVRNIELPEGNETIYYDLTGRRLKAVPTTPGVYVVRDKNGSRKVII